MKKLVQLYPLSWIFLFLVYFLFRSGIIPQGLLATNDQAIYILELLAVILSVGGVYVAIRLMSFSAVKSAIQTEGFPAYKRFCIVRIIISVFAAIFDIAAYFLAVQSTFSFCLLVVLVGFLFVKPSEKELDRIKNPDETTSAE